MTTEEERIQELVRQMYESADRAPWDLSPEDIRGRRRRLPAVMLDPKALVLLAAAVVLIVVGSFVFGRAPDKSVVGSAATTTTASASRRTIVVPNVVGSTQTAAVSALRAVGLRIGTVSLEASSDLPAGDVITSQVAPGALAAPDSSINLTVSSGPLRSTGSTLATTPPTTAPANPASTTPTTTVSTPPGTLVVAVTSVTAVLTPYNPAYSSGGIPAEQVSFDITGVVTGSVACTVEVLHKGATVGGTTVTIGLPITTRSSTTPESVDVSPLSVATFNGTLSDARVTCRS
jgi:hypothetical protein